MKITKTNENHCVSTFFSENWIILWIEVTQTITSRGNLEISSDSVSHLASGMPEQPIAQVWDHCNPGGLSIFCSSFCVFSTEIPTVAADQDSSQNLQVGGQVL